MLMKEELIIIENGRIEEKGTAVFSDLNFQIYKNQIMGIIFDSIIERKYLKEFFRGELILQDGKAYIEGRKADPYETGRYLRENLTIIEKDSKLISNLHIEENIFLFTDKKKLINRRKYFRELQRIMQVFQLELRINLSVEELTVKERVIVELLKAYVEGKKIVLLMHISGFLKRTELEEINQLLNKLLERGMTFVLVEQFENIIFEWTKQLVVIRHGKTAGIFDPGNLNREILYSSLIKDHVSGRIAGMSKLDMIHEEESRPVLQFEKVCTDVLVDFSIEVCNGEVLKIYYMDDLSCEHIIALLKGLIKPQSGIIFLSNREYKGNSIVQAVKKGICFIEESPYDNMLFYNLSVRDNLSMALSKKVPLFWLRNRFVKSVDQLIKSVSIEDIAKVKLRKLEPHILQQIAYYKWYLYAPKVVVCIKPFTETDLYLQEVTVEMIRNLKARGIAVIILTPNHSELYRIDGDTIFVKNGSLIDEDEVYQILYKE